MGGRESIHQKVKLKLPADNLEANDARYHYTLVTPAAFATYTPTTEKLPPNIHAPIPSLCVRILSGEDSLATNNGTAEIQMCFSAWDPGLHGADIFNPSKDKPGTWERWDTEEAKQYFKRNGTGWRDIWNFVDVALRAVESMPIIEGYRIEPNAPIKFGPLTEAGSNSRLLSSVVCVDIFQDYLSSCAQHRGLSKISIRRETSG